MSDEPKKNERHNILGEMAEAHEEQPGENPQSAADNTNAKSRVMPKPNTHHVKMTD